VSAGRILFEQQYGDLIPFYLQSRLGGKETLRGFGEGRFTDKGRWVAGFEERIRIDQISLMNVLTEFELSPFVEVGSVFRKPNKIRRKDFEPVVGAAIRAVVRPQVVGSIDLGFGSDGLATFLNLNYSY